KLKRRMQICSIMMEKNEARNDEKELLFWAGMLVATEKLGKEGMSSEDEGFSGQEKVKLVKDLDFRHPEFRVLFEFLDKLRPSNPFFNQAGRKAIPRVLCDTISKREPPSNLPPAFYRPEYLEKMNKGQVQKVALAMGIDAEYSIPRLADILCYAVLV
ncbi:hypothetical protein K435DRAFT_669156, partial [Dendrothele bispora CBS 962.96]